jgi:hypothetical protein
MGRRERNDIGVLFQVEFDYPTFPSRNTTEPWGSISPIGASHKKQGGRLLTILQPNLAP